MIVARHRGFSEVLIFYGGIVFYAQVGEKDGIFEDPARWRANSELPSGVFFFVQQFPSTHPILTSPSKVPFAVRVSGRRVDTCRKTIGHAQNGDIKSSDSSGRGALSQITAAAIVTRC